MECGFSGNPLHDPRLHLARLSLQPGLTPVGTDRRHGAVVFTVSGVLTFLTLPGLGMELNREDRLLIAEVALVMLLFADATRIDLRVLRGNRNLPVRLLSTGMLLPILLGAIGAVVLLRGLSLWEAGTLAAVLAPTDAGLGQVIVSSPRVPLRIRHTRRLASLGPGALEHQAIEEKDAG